MVVNPLRTDPELALKDSLPKEITAPHHLTSHGVIHLMATLHANSHQVIHKRKAQILTMLVRDTKTALNMTLSLKTNLGTNQHTRVKISTGPTTGTNHHVGVPIIPTTVNNLRAGAPVIQTGAPIRMDLNKGVDSGAHKEAITNHKQTASQEKKSIEP